MAKTTPRMLSSAIIPFGIIFPIPEEGRQKSRGQQKRNDAAEGEPDHDMAGQKQRRHDEQNAADRTGDERSRARGLDVAHDPAGDGEETEDDEVNFCRTKHR